MKKCFLILLLISSVLFTGCSTKEETKYFDFTVSELVETLNKEYNIDLKSSNIVDSEDGSKSAAYTFNQENRFSHYQITYNEKEKVSFGSRT